MAVSSDAENPQGATQLQIIVEVPENARPGVTKLAVDVDEESELHVLVPAEAAVGDRLRLSKMPDGPWTCVVLRTWYLAGELLSAFSVIERSKGRFGCIAGATASRSAAVHSRKQPLHDLANRIAEQPGEDLNKLQLLVPAAVKPGLTKLQVSLSAGEQVQLSVPEYASPGDLIELERAAGEEAWQAKFTRDQYLNGEDDRAPMPHVDDQGEASEYKFALQALVADHEHAMFDGLEQLLSSAASRCGTCQLDDFKFRPSRQLQSLRMQRHACGDARAHRALSLQIFRMHRREVRVWKASKIQRVLQASSWSSMKWLLFTSGGKLKLQPSPDEFAEELGKLFCANPPLPCRPQFLTENAWSMRELLSALRRMKVNKAADEVGLVVELLQHAPSSSPPHAALQCCPRAWAAGLQCAARTALAACWAAWADALPVLHARRRDAAARCLAELTQGPASAAACLRAAEEAGRLLDRTNWTGRPSWSDLLNNLRPAQCDLPELGKRCQGWQHHGSRACSSHFRETELLPAPLAVGAACCSLAQPPDRMLITLWRRLRLPLLVPYTDAANMATAALLMHMVTTMPPAPAQAFSPAEPNLWSTPGCALLERLSDLRARLQSPVIRSRKLTLARAFCLQVLSSAVRQRQVRRAAVCLQHRLDRIAATFQLRPAWRGLLGGRCWNRHPTASRGWC
eukprot:s2867_g2.t1